MAKRDYFIYDVNAVTSFRLALGGTRGGQLEDLMAFWKNLIGALVRRGFPHLVRMDELNGSYFVPATCAEVDVEIERIRGQRDAAYAAIMELTGCDESVLRALLDVASLEELFLRLGPPRGNGQEM